MSDVDVEKILKWVGFVYEPLTCDCSSCQSRPWIAPNAKEYPNGMLVHTEEPDILNSMDACIEYLEPVLFKKGYLYRLRRIYGGHRMQIVRPSTKGPGYEKVEKWEDVIVIIMDSKPAMAFSKAVERFIDSEIKQ